MVSGVNTGKQSATYRSKTALNYFYTSLGVWFLAPTVSEKGKSGLRNVFIQTCKMTPSCSPLPVAQRTTDQANIVADTTVAGANEVAQQTVDGVENAAVSTGLVNPVSHVPHRLSHTVSGIK